MKRRRIQLDSRATEVDRLLDWLAAQLVQSPLDKMAAFRLQCALVETVNNVIRHAYQDEPGHPIEVELSVSAEHVTLAVRDQGPAYTPPDSLTPSHPSDQSGRGHEIIRTWVDEVRYGRNADGNTCRLSQRL